ncbi:MAG: rcc01693 family protein [Pseudomonadota bacterium]
MAGLDWPGLMRAGLGGLGLTPAEFWRLTPAELMLMLGDPASARPMSRGGLADLMAAWPDRNAGEKHGGCGPAGQLERGGGAA